MYGTCYLIGSLDILLATKKHIGLVEMARQMFLPVFGGFKHAFLYFSLFFREDYPIDQVLVQKMWLNHGYGEYQFPHILGDALFQMMVASSRWFVRLSFTSARKIGPSETQKSTTEPPKLLP